MQQAKSIEEYKSSINEFNRAFESANYRIIPGLLSVRQGKNLIQFDGVLLGRRRYLNIETGPGGMRFYETGTKMETGKRVFLIQQNTCCMDDGAFRAVLFLKQGDAADPSEILKKYFNFDAGRTEYPSSLVVMDFTNIYTFMSINPFWEKGPEVSYLVQASGNDYNEVMNEIHWHERSFLQYIMMHGFYILTVPADIITSPFQLIGIFLLGNGLPR